MSDVDQLLDSIANKLPAERAAWPGGWPGEIEAALLDAVLSIRSRYGSPTTGVRGAVAAYRKAFGSPLDDLTRLQRLTKDELTSLVGRQRTSGRLKAEAILEVAANLVSAGVRHAEQLDPVAHHRSYTSVKGLGEITWSYFCMLLGHQDVKADTWIQRFVGESLGRSTNSKEAQNLVTQAATRLQVDARDLDHAIWSYMRSA